MAFHVQRPRCPYCHEDVTPGEGRGCATCMGWTHGECWDEYGRCPSCDAEAPSAPSAAPAAAPPTGETRSAIRILVGLLIVVLIATIATLVVSLLR